MNNSCYEYWDGGSEKLHEFLQKHELACKENWICEALNLSHAVVEEKSLSPTLKVVEGPPPQKRKRGDLSYIIHEISD